MGLVEAIVGLVVLVGTPLLTWLGVRHTNKTTLDAAVKANEATVAAAIAAAQAQVTAAIKAAEAQVASAIEAGDASRDTAAVQALTATQQLHEARFWRACEAAWSDNPQAHDGGVSILQAMVAADTLDPEELAIVYGALGPYLRPAMERVGDSAAEKIAELPTAGDAGGLGDVEGGDGDV